MYLLVDQQKSWHFIKFDFNNYQHVGTGKFYVDLKSKTKKLPRMWLKYFTNS